MATAKTQIFTELIIDGETGEQIIRELTAEEISQRQSEAVAIQTAQAAKAAARQSALAKLAELGLTEEEIAAL